MQPFLGLATNAFCGLQSYVRALCKVHTLFLEGATRVVLTAFSLRVFSPYLYIGLCARYNTSHVSVSLMKSVHAA